MTDDHLARLGFAIIRAGWLKRLRTSLRLSRRRLAEIMGISIQTVQRWEEEQSRVWAASAVQIGQFYVDILNDLDTVLELGELFQGYLPASEMASYLAQPTPMVVKRCEAGELECLDLGRLGTFVKAQSTT